MTQAKATTDEFDSPWKDIIERYFPNFLEFFFPNVEQIIDWSRGYEFLDKELQKVLRRAKLGKRLADKLVKVWLKNGNSAILYIHIEVQGQYDKHFPERMYVYHYRIFDCYKKVISLAILVDDHASWRPKQYHSELAGCQVTFDFPMVKLLDYWNQWKDLEKSTNPFALVVRIHLKGLETQKKPDQRLHWKMELCKALYRAKYTKQQILDLFWFMDWVLALPEDLERQFEKFYQEYEEDKKMQYVTSVERRGMEKGRQEGIQIGLLRKSHEAVVKVLRLRFKRVPKTLVESLQTIEDTSRLSKFLEQAVLVESLDEFKQLVNKSV